MREPNFICPETGEKFFIPTFRTAIDSSGSIYKDKYGKELKHPDTGVKLKPIPKEGMPTFMASETERLAKTQAHFKARAKKHANSKDGIDEKQKVKDREMSNMGYERVKKKK
jgi:hypothetical protein